MNVEAGFKSIVKYPFILVIPIVLQVLLSFLLGYGLLLGVDIQPLNSFNSGEASESAVMFQFTLPVIMPLIEDMNQPLSFLPSFGGNHWFSFISVIGYQAILSYAIAMYLSHIKKMLLPSTDHKKSPIQLGLYYFRRIFFFQLIYIILLFVSFSLLAIFLPIGILFLLIVLILSLTPYLVVLEDKQLGESIADAPKYFKRYFVKFIPLALAAFFSTFILSIFLQQADEAMHYYVLLVGYTFIGSGFIAAFMNLLNHCIQEDQSEHDDAVEYYYPRWKKAIMFMLILTLPWVGVKFAKGDHVTAIPLQNSTTFSEGVSFYSNWSNAFNGSDHHVATYGFDQSDVLELSIILPETLASNDIYGRGEVTWPINQEVITRNGRNTIYDGEEVITTSDFIYRLHPAYQNDTVYYTSANGGLAKPLKQSQFDELTNMELFVMNDGQDVFVFQYKERFDPQHVIRVDHNAEYLTPKTSRNNPEDYKYVWYSKERMTRDRILDFLHAKNKTMMHIGGTSNYLEFEYIVAAFLQEADGEALMRFDEENMDLNMKTNIASQTEESWSNKLNNLYGEVDFKTFLSYLNKANMHSEYEQIGWEDRDTFDSQLIVPFPKGDVIIHTEREDGKVISIEIELPEESK